MVVRGESRSGQVRQVWSVVVVWGWVCLGQAGTVGVGELRYVGAGWGKVS